jgi:hypothetical protein
VRPETMHSLALIWGPPSNRPIFCVRAYEAPIFFLYPLNTLDDGKRPMTEEHTESDRQLGLPFSLETQYSVFLLREAQLSRDRFAPILFPPVVPRDFHF